MAEAMRDHNSLSSRERQELNEKLRLIKNIDQNGHWWSRVKEPLSAILSLVVATGKVLVALKATAGGIFVQYKVAGMSFNLAGGAFKTSALLTATGPAALVGAGVAAAVYFIPWFTVFSWIQGFFSSIWDTIRRWVENFQRFLSSLAAESENVQPQRRQRRRNSGRRSVPMTFSHG
ncbi:uncharacterized protein PV06_09352 [Exophiala oligosperma]|uniref:Uncharacterized protein n=1 Tax=Exophiala oligosperma TaxID=215243 RepID=A0A0D2ADY3_9EURO|nr:uncharacterized protein PV06_09352 [Exophiala oligosperma]KIW38381.1 hypothetical protein PV06_09352 [Exophiala oligosperma]